MTQTVFKLVDRPSWEAAAVVRAVRRLARRRARRLHPLLDGGAGARDRLARHFAGQSDLVLVAVAADGLATP
jgi:uncharacterized protein (DUF952 family)